MQPVQCEFLKLEKVELHEDEKVLAIVFCTTPTFVIFGGCMLSLFGNQNHIRRKYYLMSQLLPAQLLTPSFDILGHHCSLLRQKVMKNGRKLNSLLHCIPFYSGFFQFTFLPYVYVSPCTYAQDSQKQKRNRSQRRKKNQVSSANTVAETLATKGKVKK